MLAQACAGFVAFGPRGIAVYNSVIEAVKMGLAQSIHNVFVLSLGIIIVGLLEVFFLKEIPLLEGRGRGASKKSIVPGDTEQSAINRMN